MATINYEVLSESKMSPIYVRLSFGRNNNFRKKTGLFIDSKDWNFKKKEPKDKKAYCKNLSSDLRGLKKYLYDEINNSNSLGVDINREWAVQKIDEHFNRVELVELDYLIDYGEKFLEDLKYKVNPKTKKRGVVASTQKKYRTIVNKLIEFDKYKKRKSKLVDVDLNFRNDLIKYFDKVEKLSDNTIGRYLKFVKSICLDAKKNGFTVSQQLDHFQGFTVDSPKIILTLDEIEQIKNKVYLKEAHEITRDWLMIGCFTGQRVSDIMRMDKAMIQHIQDFDFIVLEQTKTNKTVQIPIHFEVQEILDKRNGEFPPTFAKTIDSNKTLFNRYLKEVCKLAQIDAIVNGNRFDEVKKRYINGDYPKHELVASHICRRSFASNFYGNPLFPTPILMNITAHSTEKDFLGYIGKKPIDYSLQLAKVWQDVGVKEKQKQLKISKLDVIKNLGS